MGGGEFVLGSGYDRASGLVYGLELPARTRLSSRTSFGGTTVMFARLIWVIDETPHPAALNMAIDEALLFSGGDCPLFRAYRWRQRPVSIGYFSSWEQAVTVYPGREIVRRWTGGGMVEHGDDFTYSLLLPVNCRTPGEPGSLPGSAH